MAKRAGKEAVSVPPVAGGSAGRPSALVDTRVIYCGDNLEQLKKLPAACVDLVYIDPPFNSNRNYEVFWGETKEKRAFADRHASTQAYIDFMRPRCVELARVLRKPAPSTTTATGTPPTTSRSCSTKSSARITFRTRSFGRERAPIAARSDMDQ